MKFIIPLFLFALSSAGQSELLRLTPKQESQTSLDKPLSQLLWDPPRNNVWFVGNQYLWKWSVESSELQRVHFGSKKIENLTLTIDYLWGLRSNRLIRIDKGTLKTRSFDFDRFGGIKAISTSGPDLLLGTESGIYTLNTKSNSLKKASEISARKGDQISSNLEIWRNHNGLIKQSNVASQKKLLTCRKDNGIKVLDKFTFYRCGEKIYRLKNTGKLLQVVHNQSISKINNWSIGEKLHSYLFQNGILEVYSLPTQSLSSYQIDMTHQVKTFEVTDNLLVGLTGSYPFLQTLSHPIHQDHY